MNNENKRKQVYDREKERGKHFKRLFGITVDEYDKRVLDQESKCGICKRVSTQKVHNRLAIDHDHNTGQIRALLCRSCNLLLGFIEKRPEFFTKAYDYLHKWAESGE